MGARWLFQRAPARPIRRRGSLLCGLALCCLASPAVAAPPTPRLALDPSSRAASPVLAAANVNPARLRALVEGEARKAGAKAVEFGLWVGDRAVLVTALGQSMTGAGHDRHALPDRRDRRDLHVHAAADAGRTRADRSRRADLALVSAPDVGRQGHGADAGGNTAGYPDYVTQPAFVAAQLADPFRGFTDDDLIGYATAGGRMNFPPGSSRNIPTPTT